MSADLLPPRVVEASTEIEVKGHKAWVFRRMREGKLSEYYYVKGCKLPGDDKQWLKCTGWTTKADAVKTAKTFWKAKIEGRHEVLKQSAIRKETQPATIGELIQAHEKGIKRVNPMLSEGAAVGYQNALRRLVAWAQGMHEEAEEDAKRLMVDTAQVDAVSASVLTSNLIDDFLERYLVKAGENPLRKAQCLRGAHTVLRNARSMFDRDGVKCFGGLKVPDLADFLEHRIVEAPRVKHRALEDTAVAEMSRAAMLLKVSDPALYLVHLLSRHFATRNDELMNARVGWLEKLERPRIVTLQDQSRFVVAVLNIETTANFDPKGNSGRVPISPCVWAELEPYLQDRKPDDFLVPAPHETERYKIIYRRHADFVRPWTAGHQKKAYELRRWASTKVANLHGSMEMMQRFLRHSEKSTAELHYLTDPPMPAPITLADCGL